MSSIVIQSNQPPSLPRTQPGYQGPQDREMVLIAKLLISMALVHEINMSIQWYYMLVKFDHVIHAVSRCWNRRCLAVPGQDWHGSRLAKLVIFQLQLLGWQTLLRQTRRECSYQTMQGVFSFLFNKDCFRPWKGFPCRAQKRATFSPWLLFTPFHGSMLGFTTTPFSLYLEAI